MENGLVHAIIMDKNGGAKNINYEELLNYKEEDGILWAHFDYSSKEAIEWINDKSGIDPIAAEALLEEETRPRTTILDDNILLALRGVNLNPDSDPEDMISIRLFISPTMIISTKKRNLLSVKDILEMLEHKKGPCSSAEFLISILDRLTCRMEGTIDGMQDRSLEIEELAIESNSYELGSKISTIRREAIAIRRYLSPQREAMFRLYHEKVTWLSEYDRIQLQEINNQLIRYIEELDSINDKIALVLDEIANKTSEQINKRMYFLSIISAIFLPLGFLTGLLGVNVGGIPGAENSSAFAIFIIILFILGTIQFYLLKKNRWI
ncbi:zinc transporter ZntB [Halarcobacter ebronensis]|uniref:Zinc transporter ZntB n=1 Tax=Halarcobacter ebronensis TaxID=1462615 RepID=A0A4Q0YER9_9BACT|nr:zinc transporter ZntB [Halarcobacter ebronensis]RXJ67341.1 zinc transporter ZntB [Halarcobacter ebronensis]